MIANKDHLFEAFERLINLKNECSCGILSECGMSEMTVKQIGYLKVIAGRRNVTFSGLAEITRNSKPTISEMVDRFVRMDCAYRERSPDDGRIVYIRLTEKGQMIAEAERNALNRLIERITNSLSDEEIDLLIELLKKVR